MLLIYSMCTGDMTLLTLTFRRHNQITHTEVIQEHVNANQAQPTGSPAREHVVNSMLYFFFNLLSSINIKISFIQFSNQWNFPKCLIQFCQVGLFNVY